MESGKILDILTDKIQNIIEHSQEELGISEEEMKDKIAISLIVRREGGFGHSLIGKPRNIIALCKANLQELSEGFAKFSGKSQEEAMATILCDMMSLGIEKSTAMDTKNGKECEPLPVEKMKSVLHELRAEDIAKLL